MLDSDANKKLMEIIAAVSEPALTFHTEQNVQLRSAADASAWYIAAAKGDFMSHVARILGVMAHVPSLQQAGMLVDGSAVARATDADEGLDAELSEVMAKFSTSFASHRLRRGLWLMRGWPFRMLACLDSPMALRESILTEFKRDLDTWDQAKALLGPGRIMTIVLKRHCMQKVSNEQLVTALTTFSMEDSIARFCIRRAVAAAVEHHRWLPVERRPHRHDEKHEDHLQPHFVQAAGSFISQFAEVQGRR
jgi:hypothetical protein